MNLTVVVIEDDENQLAFLKRLLQDNSYLPKVASTGLKGLELVEKYQPDLVLLDLCLPDIDGESIFKRLKSDFPNLPFIILTAKNSSEDIVRGLKLGADDYVSKPYDSDELLARIKARIKTKVESEKLKIDDLVLDTKTFEVTRESKSISLTPTEFKLLEYLMANKNQVLSRDMILGRVWTYSSDVESRVVDVHMGYLRKKIDQPFKKKLIHSSRGFGYSIKSEV